MLENVEWRSKTMIEFSENHSRTISNNILEVFSACVRVWLCSSTNELETSWLHGPTVGCISDSIGRLMILW